MPQRAATHPPTHLQAPLLLLEAGEVVLPLAGLLTCQADNLILHAQQRWVSCSLCAISTVASAAAGCIRHP